MRSSGKIQLCHALLTARLMDSEVQRDGRVLDLTDDAWREDRLPYEDVTIPLVTSQLATNTPDQRTAST